MGVLNYAASLSDSAAVLVEEMLSNINSVDWYCHLSLFLIESEVTSPMLFHETEDCLVLNTCFVTLPCGWKLLSGYPYVKYLSCHYCKSRLVVDVADPHWLKETYDLLPNFY